VWSVVAVSLSARFTLQRRTTLGASTVSVNNNRGFRALAAAMATFDQYTDGGASFARPIGIQVIDNRIGI